MMRGTTRWNEKSQHPLIFQHRYDARPIERIRDSRAYRMLAHYYGTLVRAGAYLDGSITDVDEALTAEVLHEVGHECFHGMNYDGIVAWMARRHRCRLRAARAA
jgi:hypothetical protein